MSDMKQGPAFFPQKVGRLIGSAGLSEGIRDPVPSKYLLMAFQVIPAPRLRRERRATASSSLAWPFKIISPMAVDSREPSVMLPPSRRSV